MRDRRQQPRNSIRQIVTPEAEKFGVIVYAITVSAMFALAIFGSHP